VELKLARVGPLPMEIDREELYARMEEAHAEYDKSKKGASSQDKKS
jgi:hypothetical protein